MIYNDKKIAVLLATYQGEKFIIEQLDSLLKQTNKEWKAFIHDDGSLDKTKMIINDYIQNYPDCFCYIDSPSTGGAKNNFMLLTNIVESEFYMYCDQDDVWLDNKIQKTYDKMLEIYDEDIPCLVHTDLSVVDENLNIISKSMNIYQKLNCQKINLSRSIIQNTVTGCTMMINKALREKMIIPCDYNKIIMHDWWASIIANAFGRVSYLNEQTILYRQHGNNSVGAKKSGSLFNVLDIILNSKKVTNSLLDTRLQAEEFNKTFGNMDIVHIYSNVGHKNKLERLYTYQKYGFYKSSFLRNIGLIIFG